MTDNLFRPSKEMREYDALRANAEKAELLRAAETLKKYCEKHCAKGCADGETGCLFSDMCDEYFIIYGGMSNIMGDIAHDVRYSDDD